MTLSADARLYMALRENLPPVERSTVADAMAGVYQAMARSSLSAATDDRAAELEAAIIRFVIDSRTA
jgi:hypothetical protein